VTRRFCTMCIIFFTLAIAVAGEAARAQQSDDRTGRWTGTWDGAGTGGFDLVLEKNADGTLGGRLSVTGEPTYNVTLKTVSFDGPKMTATYDFPPDESMEVLLAATFDGNTAKGTWTAREKSGGAQVATGGWTVTRSK
jgi:hypothetical protein